MSDMGDVLGGHTPLEESVAHLVTTRLVLEADGEVVLAVMREVEFRTFLSGDVQVNLTLAQIAQECRMVKSPHFQSLKTRLGSLLSKRKDGRANMGSLLLHLVQKIRQVVGCVKV